MYEICVLFIFGRLIKKQEDHEVPQNMIDMLKQQFHIERATIQIETLKIKHNEMIV